MDETATARVTGVAQVLELHALNGASCTTCGTRARIGRSAKTDG